MNILDHPTPGTLSAHGLSWGPGPLKWEALQGGGMRVSVPEKCDYFQDPGGVVRKDDAPNLSMLVSGDFVATARVRPNWATVWDAAALMVRQDAAHWAKLCFESTDIGTKAVVSVVTNGTSDDANGADLTVGDVWLQICRIGRQFGLHYALDGHLAPEESLPRGKPGWRMVRVFGMDMPAEVRVGLVAQCPAGPGVAIDWLTFSLEARTVKDLRAGI
jgi:regulation of enolase protein 1 (concanavalin A-like superfamily)